MSRVQPDQEFELSSNETEMKQQVPATDDVQANSNWKVDETDEKAAQIMPDYEDTSKVDDAINNSDMK